jgi:hypothetical protein
MTNEDIIRMAREAGLCDDDGYSYTGNMPDIERFAALVAAAEREACAKFAYEVTSYEGIADAIRARGQS